MLKPIIGGRESDYARETSYMNRTKSNLSKHFEINSDLKETAYGDLKNNSGMR